MERFFDKYGDVSPRYTNCRGFTFIELLTTLAICAVLMGVLVPVLVSAKRAAKSTVEISQLRQLGLAQTIYSQENDSGGVAELSTLVDLGLVSKQLCASPNDKTRDGIANEMIRDFAAHSDLYSKAILPYPSTYVGFHEFQYPEAWFARYVNVNPNSGWLVSLTETGRQNPRTWETMFSGTYRRLLFDGAVIVRRHKIVATGDGEAQHPLLMFSDGSDQWNEEFISTAP